MKIILEGTSEEVKNVLDILNNENNVINLTVNQTEKVNIPEEYVDLGLPSGTLWAKCNIGATKPEEYGLYYQWGDTVGYTGYEAVAHSYWETAPFNGGASDCNSESFSSVRNTICPNGVLAPKHDAVFQATGGKAHMPTKEQFEELKEYTTRDWVIVNGVMGGKFTSKKDSTKYIFIPTSGGQDFGKLYGRGSRVYLWSSSLRESYPSDAWVLGFYANHCYVSSFYRCRGFCVRGVIG